MNYATVCSGIEACSVAWHPLGWVPQFFSEIEPFPSAVLAHHYPNVPNLGDMTKWKDWPDADIDVICGGTPCQSFSVAGLRKGMADPRGNLALTFLAIVDRYRPTWLVWENVPGVLSSNGGRDFGAILGGMVELGYGVAYRVLDAQYFGVAQRRRRVFVVGCLGDWRRAAAVLFERHSMQGHPAPSRKTGQGVAGTFKACAGSGGWTNSADHAAAGYMQPVAPTLRAGGNRTGGDRPPGTDVDTCDSLICMSSGQANAEIQKNVSTTLTTLHEAPIVAHDLRGEGFDASEDGTGRGTPLVPVVGAICKDSFSGGAGGRPEGAAAGHFIPIQNATRGKDQNGLGIAQPGDPMFTLDQGSQHGVAFAIQGAATRENPASGPDGVGVRADNTAYTLEARAEVQAIAFDCKASGQNGFGIGEIESTMRAMPHNGSHQNGGGHQAVAVALRGREGGATAELSEIPSALRASGGGGDKAHVLNAMQVRRLTPMECERLQGFPDNYTLITVRNKPAADGPRYKALGNSMAVPVMHWIGRRIELVDSIKSKGSA